ncbi:MAG: hypothetical protein JW874_08580, partial [Spirochaetales bacterium]|nr:hypothetical protein [Spirochaetales bacterium]
PKGEISVTLQYIRYIEKLHPEHEFEYLYPGRRIKAILKDSEMESGVFEKIGNADLVLWAFPLYYMNVHGNLKRFIELAFAKYRQVFAGKYAAALCTSILFYDHLAVNYIHAVSEDLGMQFIDAYSAKMDDLLSEKGQEKTRQFAGFVFQCMENKVKTVRRYPPLPTHSWEYTASLKGPELETGKKILIVTDSEEGNIGNMIDAFRACFRQEIEIVNLNTIRISGPCLGCLKCGANNICAYEEKDDYIDMFRNKILKADILVWAGEIRDRYLSWQWGQFFDRSFFKTHQPMVGGKEFIFLISGPFSRIGDLSEHLSAYVEMEGSRLAAYVTDECGDGSQLDEQIRAAAQMAVWAAEAGYNSEYTFRADGGRKIFRDEIYAGLRVVFRGDHRAYKKTGFYNLPAKGLFAKIKLHIAMVITGIPLIKKLMREHMAEGMISRLKKVPEKATARFS